MTREAIIDKIATRLSQGINTEEDCVYLLAQIRKYLEQQDIQGYWNLRMCANWTLHSNLDNVKNRTVLEFLNEINSFLMESEQIGSYDIDRFPGLKYKLMFLTALQEELKAFLTSVGIDTSICDDPAKLRAFLGIFGQVIEDTPLICKINASSYRFNEITFSKRKSVISPELWPSSLYWTIKKENRVILRIKTNLVAVPIGDGYIYVESLAFITNSSLD